MSDEQKHLAKLGGRKTAISKRRKILLGSLLVVLVSIGGFAGYMLHQNLDQPLHRVFTLDTVLAGAQKLYQKPNPGFFEVGNDSEVSVIYRLADGKAQQLLASHTVLTACERQPRACSAPPTWRPRSSFVSQSGPQYQIGSDLARDKPIQQLYLTMAKDKNTLCAAYDTTYGEAGSAKPNIDLLCVNAPMKLLSYEYISSADSVTF